VNDITFDEVVSAYYDCRKNKRNTAQQIKFEFRLEENLWKLYEDLKKETYTPGSHIYKFWSKFDWVHCKTIFTIHSEFN
jgi:hypothetical protein